MNTYPVRKFTNMVLMSWTALCALFAVGILIYLLAYIFLRGVSYVNIDFFTQTPKALGAVGGGAKNSVIGTFIMVGLASAMGIPLGLGAGIFLNEYAGPRAGGAIRFLADVLS